MAVKSRSLVTDVKTSGSTLASSCALCGRQRNLTFHHLIPKQCHKNKWFKKQFDLEDMRNRGITLCRRCHSFIHKQFTEKYLGRYLNTLDLLLEEDRIRVFVAWAKKQRVE